MTAFSRAFILAGLVAVTGATGALAGTRDRDGARPQYENPVPAQQAPILQEGRSSAVGAASVGSAAEHRDERSWLTDRRSSDDNN